MPEVRQVGAGGGAQEAGGAVAAGSDRGGAFLLCAVASRATVRLTLSVICWLLTLDRRGQ